MEKAGIVTLGGCLSNVWSARDFLWWERVSPSSKIFFSSGVSICRGAIFVALQEVSLCVSVLVMLRTFSCSDPEPPL